MLVHNLNCKHTYPNSESMLINLFSKVAYMKPIGEILKEARESLKMSQEGVAAKVRKLTGETFSRAALAQIESGSTKTPKPHNLQAACDVLGIDFRSALSGEIIRIRTTSKAKSSAPPYPRRLSIGGKQPQRRACAGSFQHHSGCRLSATG